MDKPIAASMKSSEIGSGRSIVAVTTRIARINPMVPVKMARNNNNFPDLSDSFAMYALLFVLAQDVLNVLRFTHKRRIPQLV